MRGAERRGWLLVGDRVSETGVGLEEGTDFAAEFTPEALLRLGASVVRGQRANLRHGERLLDGNHDVRHGRAPRSYRPVRARVRG